MAPEIVLLGATGYTGRLVAGELVEMGERPVLAGRDPVRLAEMARASGGLRTKLADVRQAATLEGLVSADDVLVSTVGPFTLYGRAVLDAALAGRAHYLDSTGEPAFMRDVFDRAGPIAARSGHTLVTAFGYDYVPGNVAGSLAAERAGAGASRLDVGYMLPGTGLSAVRADATAKWREPVVSTGTRASLLAICAAPAHARRHGQLVLEPTAKRLGAFEIDGRTRQCSSVGGSEPLALCRSHAGLEDISVYMELPGPARAARGATLGLSLGMNSLARSALGRRALDAATKAAARSTGGGPSEEVRKRSGTLVVATCFSGRGERLAQARVEGPVNGYTLTGRLLAWGAKSLLAGDQRAAGAVGPVEAFGLAACRTALTSFGLSTDASSTG